MWETLFMCNKKHHPSPPQECSRPSRRWTCTHPSRPQPRVERYAACGRLCYCGRVSSSVRCEPLWNKAAPPYCLHTATPAGRRFKKRNEIKASYITFVTLLNVFPEVTETADKMTDFSWLLETFGIIQVFNL